MISQNEFQTIATLSMERMLERHTPDYGFIDTKFQIVTGEDFASDNGFRGRGHVYSWIQGRGIESLAKHADYFETIGNHSLAERLDTMLANVTQKMESCRAKNQGRLPFVMTPQGVPLSEMRPEVNFSDLFYSKGLLAAALRLGTPQWKQEAKSYFRLVVEEIAAGRFRSDQKSFDPKNPQVFSPDKVPQGPRMISLFGLADFARAFPEEDWNQFAEKFIRYIYGKHVILQPRNGLQKFDFVENVHPDGTIYLEKTGQIQSDPGHALEFVGLAAKCLLVMKDQRQCQALLEESRKILPGLFCHVFDYGHQTHAHGIAKSFDLAGRTFLNSDMPWWNLPETIRAGWELQQLFPEQCQGVQERMELAWEDFSRYFYQNNGFACQTRDEQGKIVNVIPALPDADPGYHTNLSLMALFH